MWGKWAASITKPRLRVFARCLIAIIGGYLLASLFNIALVQVFLSELEYPLGDSVLISTMFSHAVFFITIILCFCPFSLKLIFSIMTTAIFSLAFIVRYIDAV